MNSCSNWSTTSSSRRCPEPGSGAPGSGAPAGVHATVSADWAVSAKPAGLAASRSRTPAASARASGATCVASSSSGLRPGVKTTDGHDAASGTPGSPAFRHRDSTPARSSEDFPAPDTPETTTSPVPAKRADMRSSTRPSPCPGRRTGPRPARRTRSARGTGKQPSPGRPPGRRAGTGCRSGAAHPRPQAAAAAHGAWSRPTARLSPRRRVPLGLPALPPLRRGPSRLAGMHSTHRSTAYPCSAAARTAEAKESAICRCWPRATPRMKNFACQTVTRPFRSPATTSMPQSPGLARTRLASPDVARTSRPSICSKSPLAPSWPARA